MLRITLACAVTLLLAGGCLRDSGTLPTDSANPTEQAQALDAYLQGEAASVAPAKSTPRTTHPTGSGALKAPFLFPSATLAREDCGACVGAGCGEPEDGELRLSATVQGRDVLVTASIRATSAWWLDLDWLDCEWPGVPEEELPVPSIAALGADVFYSPVAAVESAIPGPQGGDIPWTASGWNWFPEGKVRIGGFVEMDPCGAYPGCPFLMDGSAWYDVGTVALHLADGFSGRLEFQFGDTVDDIYALGDVVPPVVIRVPSPPSSGKYDRAAR